MDNNSYIPEGYHSVTPYLIVRDVAAQIDFLIRAFDAEETERMTRPDGSISHAEVCLGSSAIMLGQVAEAEQPMPAMLYVYVPDVDTTYHQALAAGAKSMRAPRDEFYGDRTAIVADSNGNQWVIAMFKERLTHAELERRAQQAYRQE